MTLVESSISSASLLAFLAEASLTPPPSPPIEIQRGTKRLRPNPKEEVAYLTMSLAHLERQLHSLREHELRMSSLSGPWKLRAMSEAHFAQRALLENARLKAALDDQRQKLRAIERLSRKRPTLAPAITDELLWKQGILSAVDQEAQLETLLLHQRETLESEWIRHGLLDVIERFESLQRISTTPSRLLEGPGNVHVVNCAVMPLSFRTMSQVVWDLKRKRKDFTCPSTREFHANLMYGRDLRSDELPSLLPDLDSRFGNRRYIEADRIIIVWRAILEDQAHPHADGAWVENSRGWVTIHDMGDNECYLSALVTISTPIHATADDDRAAETMRDRLLQYAENMCKIMGSAVEDAVRAHLANV
ncbi:hypothetical protein SPRG_09533 [Saprolegnia parasitica CBS 223.65]|uniref:START domain-containing protein n=1 Tax=Saprolegnia parasitica (strain CBS 223.65) TaxID=695850 RepID=A0A067C279_SAPPC|nr:hypothetical protein SPRG_09533 [Saprolegnia parasitica CBS 223.65]KDO24889.1 hypothetical protein SPRG_09533 [Saprolegnia parasitica CBS 223.65]|eukprot:XP_012204349.1 hypothetical protein SPRG_09533 [Saprolegnia parasitica CBS 223.65]